VVPMARSLGVGEEYEYLRPSIKRFPIGSEQVRLAKAAGFRTAVHYEIGLGLMGVLVGSV
jgi:demethylmenaquinone methyltransferase/2-methoxy-6-polyprenyl-1,4-benzoquinol methylase